MSFRDLHPYGDAPATRHLDAFSGEKLPGTADDAVYRAMYRAIPIAGLPDRIQVGEVTIFGVAGPVLSQSTQVRQRPGLTLVFDKVQQTAVEVGAGEWLTVAHLTVDAAADPARSFTAWRDVVSEAVAALAVLLDERVALELLAEDLVFLVDGEPSYSADIKHYIRSFLPYEAREDECESIAGLDALGREFPGDVRAALRWYLKGAQAGPIADAIIYFWVALEALTPGETQSVKSLVAMLVEAGWDMTQADPDLGKLAGLRADIVHEAVEDSQRIREGFYRLEAVVRVLIRRRFELFTSWPPPVDGFAFTTKADEIAASWQTPAVRWHDTMPAPGPAPSDPALEWALVVGPPLTAGMNITVDADLPRHWTVKIEVFAALAAIMLEDEFDRGPMHVVVERFGEGARSGARVNAERISLDVDRFRGRQRVTEAQLADDMFALVPQQQLMRRGIDPDHPWGAFLLDVVGSACVHLAFLASELGADDGPGATITPRQGAPGATLVGLALTGLAAARPTALDWLEADESGLPVDEFVEPIRRGEMLDEPSTVVALARRLWLGYT